jgi:hypothetical protein
VLGDNRDTLSRHEFLGGNAFMLRMLNRYRAELGVTALPMELEATARATERQLQEETATMTLSSPQLENGRLSFEVQIGNLTGHKFPTGYPSRRAWLHTEILDASGSVVFESGAVEPTGAIRGNDSDADAMRFEPHYEEISDARQVQIYESVLGDRAGMPTTGLLTATQYLKDNRLLPRGFDKTTAPTDIGVQGEAARDPSFVGGSDRVRYRVPVTGTGPYRIQVELRYQPIGFRWAMNLEKYDAPEPRRFVGFYRAAALGSSTIVATATAAP